MSQTALFIVGAIIFAITIYGVVMTGGLLLTRRQIEQDDELTAVVEQKDLDSVLSIDVKY